MVPCVGTVPYNAPPEPYALDGTQAATVARAARPGFNARLFLDPHPVPANGLLSLLHGLPLLGCTPARTGHSVAGWYTGEGEVFEAKERAAMQVRVGCEFEYDVQIPTPSVMQVEPHAEGSHRVLQEQWEADPETNTAIYLDLFANRCRRIVLPAGHVTLRYDAVCEVPDSTDAMDAAATELPVEQLPAETLVYTLPSRYCLSDVLAPIAWDLFGAVQPGWGRVQAISDWVHEHLNFQYGASTPFTNAVDVYLARRGVCRDFTQLGITFCRALNIPARYVFGYLPDIGVPPPDAPMDFCAWFEAYLGDRWWTFDPRNNEPRTGRVVIGRGRDALDVAMVTSYGVPRLARMTVWADAYDPDTALTAAEEAGVSDPVPATEAKEEGLIAP